VACDDRHPLSLVPNSSLTPAQHLLLKMRYQSFSTRFVLLMLWTKIIVYAWKTGTLLSVNVG